MKTYTGVIEKCVKARVYSKPSILSELVGLLPRGTIILIDNYSPERHFCKIVSEDMEGYVMQPFIEIKEDTDHE